jgi:PKD repeat protein
MSTAPARPRATRKGRRRAGVLAVLIGLAAIGVAAPAGAPSGADPGDIGWEGPSYEGASGSPSGSKPQSKVWFNDGLWWATLYDTASGDFHIWRLNTATGAWTDTGTLVDTRPNSRSDALWTGQHLYVANHVFSESGGTAPAELRRYSYDSTTKTYSADAGFPVTINGVRSETLVIDREPGGRLWATWVQGGQVMVAHSTTSDTAWSAPFALPVAGSNASSDDISAVVAYKSDRIGIMWSNQDDETMSFAYHLNSSPPGTWSAREIAYSGSSGADDHIDFAAVQDVGGRVLVAAKTSRSGSAVLTHLLDRNPTTGAWTSHTYGLGGDNHTRPIAVVDSEHQRVHMFATSGQAGGSIYEKSAPLSDIEFPSGKGTPVLTDASSADLNNATSTKQTVSSATGLVVIATNDSTRRYWTHYDPLDGPGPGPTTPTASFTRSPSSGTAPLDVAFTDTSAGSPTSWAWTFGDGGTSTAQHPTHQYTAPGTYTVSLTATNAAGSDTVTQTGSVTVTSTTPPPTGTPATFAATADGLVKSTSPTKSYGTEPTLQVRSAPDPEYQSFLRFDVAGLTGTVTAAKLRVFVTDASPSSGTATRVGTGWTEASLTWNSRPAAIGGPLGSAGASTAGQWVEYDVTAGVTGNGPVAFRIQGTSTNSLIASSREGANDPQLVVTAGGSTTPTAPTASFTRSPATGAAPLTVAFTDTSTGAPTSWAWAFGDGGTSTAQHPTHQYTAPGIYTVSLTATNATGGDTVTQLASVTVTPTIPPPTGTPVTFVATADGLVQTGNPTRSYGTTTTLQVRAPTPAYESYLRFTVSGLAGAPSSAKLRLWVTDASVAGGTVTPVGTGWTEASLTWNTRPAAVGPTVATMGATTNGTWVEVDVTAAVTGNGAVALRLATPSTNSAKYSSREGTRPPELVLVP